ncbi:MAG: L-threonylcarbamoyladenylate synthase [Eubacteriales bacterium]
MQTLRLTTSEQDLSVAADIIRRGGLVAFPTETVYGLGGNALDSDASHKIYSAKGRPSDNPLIIHVAHPDDIEKYAVTDDRARLLSAIFMPGPLTLVLKKRDIVPYATTGGLDSVAVRCPSHPTARRLIELTGLPIAAPSANTSGKPSPTSARHVLEDMDGLIDAVIADGDCEIGLESSIVSLLEDKPVLLRPGAVTLEQLKDIFGVDGVSADESLLRKISQDAPVLAPGMKYRHYAPKAPVTVVKGDYEKVGEYLLARQSEGYGILCFDGDKKLLTGRNALSMGKAEDASSQAKLLFTCLRSFDALNVDRIYSRAPSPDGIGLAVLNRLLKASGFDVLEV